MTVCTAPGWRWVGSKMIPDGQQGAILAWYDARTEATTKLDVYAQKIGPSGEERWTKNGVPVCTAQGEQYNEVLVSDDDGGAILAWTDLRGSIYGQRVTRDGIVAWTPDGIRLTETDAVTPVMASDGHGGALVVWEDWTEGPRQIRAQRVSGSGILLWGTSGVGVCTVPGLHSGPKICSDGAGGAFIAWTDRRGPIPDVFTQHISPSGVPLWADQGIPVCPEPSDKRAAGLVADSGGEATVFWSDSRNRPSDYFGLFAQRLVSSGQNVWNPAGVALSDETVSEHLSLATVRDGDDLVALWHERRGNQFDTYAQRLDRFGNRLLGPAGIAIADGPGDQIYAGATSDRDHGMIVAWTNVIYGPFGSTYVAQHTDVLGGRAWGPSGVELSRSPGDSELALASDGRGGAFAAWVECCGGNTPIHVVRITDARSRVVTSGATWPTRPLDVTARAVELDTPSLNSSVGAASASYSLSREAPVDLAIFDLAGRRVRTLLRGDQPAGRHVFKWNSESMSPGVYSLRLRAGDETHSRKIVVVK